MGRIKVVSMLLLSACLIFFLIWALFPNSGLAIETDNINSRAKVATLSSSVFLVSQTWAYYPAISGNDIVYSSRDLTTFSNNDISITNKANNYRGTITNDTSYTECYPDINENWIVWSQKSATSSSQNSWDIVLYNRSNQNKSVISTRSGLEVKPLIRGTWVIWKEHNPGYDSIYAYNLTTTNTTTVRNGQNLQSQVFNMPDSDGQTVVWIDLRNGNPDVYAFNLTNQTEFAVCTNSAKQIEPCVSGNWIVWEEHRNDYDNGGTDHDFGDIYGYSISSATEVIIDNQVGITTIFPQIDGLNVVVHASVCGNMDVKARIGRYVLPINLPVTANQVSYIDTSYSRKGPPKINGNWVVWHDQRNAPTTGIDIYGYSILDDSEFVICEFEGNQTMPIIKGNLCVFNDYMRNSDLLLGANLSR